MLRNDFVDTNSPGCVGGLASEFFAQGLRAEEDPVIVVPVVECLFELRHRKQDSGQVVLVGERDESCFGSLISSGRDGEAMHER